MLSPGNGTYVHVVPESHWQTAYPLGEYALVGCTVAPGFEFSDFDLLADRPGAEAALRAHHPDLAVYL